MIFKKCGFDTKSYFVLCFAALQNARVCLCFERKSVENARFPKKHKKTKKNKIRQSSVLPEGGSLGILVSIFGRLTDVLYIYIYTMEARKAELL